MKKNKLRLSIDRKDYEVFLKDKNKEDCKMSLIEYSAITSDNTNGAKKVLMLINSGKISIDDIEIIVSDIDEDCELFKKFVNVMNELLGNKYDLSDFNKLNKEALAMTMGVAMKDENQKFFYYFLEACEKTGKVGAILSSLTDEKLVL